MSSLNNQNNRTNNKIITNTNGDKTKFTLNEDDETDEPDENKNNFKRQNDQFLADETQRKLTIKKSEPAFNTSTPLNAPEQLDLFEIWRVVPRPPYANEVLILFFYFKFYFIEIN